MAPKSRRIPILTGKKIASAKVYMGGAYMDNEDRSLELNFEDGSQFFFEIRTRPVLGPFSYVVMLFTIRPNPARICPQ